MSLQIDQITTLFSTRGEVQYGVEAVSQRQHALQSAHLAEQSNAAPELVAAALLHDLGHLLPTNAFDNATRVDDFHQNKALPFLRGLFDDAVLEPIRLHVDAKRYLCQIDDCYWASLSTASQRSLAVQGGPFSAAQAQAFIGLPFAEGAVALRRWDDLAKDPTATAPKWGHFVGLLESLRLAPAALDQACEAQPARRRANTMSRRSPSVCWAASITLSLPKPEGPQTKIHAPLMPITSGR